MDTDNSLVMAKGKVGQGLGRNGQRRGWGGGNENIYDSINNKNKVKIKKIPRPPATEVDWARLMGISTTAWASRPTWTLAGALAVALAPPAAPAPAPPRWWLWRRLRSVMGSWCLNHLMFCPSVWLLRSLLSSKPMGKELCRGAESTRDLPEAQSQTSAHHWSGGVYWLQTPLTHAPK